ncbi:amino acid ABC transporter permease [Ensifer sp. ENS04]|uniref:amino acid ABC transporter permease n=1 Tax=Ensifer sp. ENS04 TaxID=2769281 RepID=UPI00177C19EE|nr:amino acid ABC transporter permease [Ensifer sp. ENS04]MBD9538912.1 amino acid ABC transporter permease [Ensifer sp. ENS04]
MPKQPSVHPSATPRSFINDPKVRGLFYQAITVIVVAVAVYWIAGNIADNLRRANIASGYGFLKGRAGFDIGQSLFSYTSDSTYLRAFVVGATNTILVAAAGIFTATIIGFLVGVGRLSHNWLVSKLALAYVECFRNIPPLIVIFFWYTGVLALLPQPRNSVVLPFDIYLNNRGLAFPRPLFESGMGMVLLASAIAIVVTVLFAVKAKKKQESTGQQTRVLPTAFAILVGVPVGAFLLAGSPISFDLPVASKFNLEGGSVIGPEFLSVFLALAFYHAAFIAELVRAGIQGISRGQMEAAEALGLRRRTATRLVILPQALRIIVPPLTSQYLNLTKNSSLAIAVGYADLVAVGGTILNQTGQAVEVVSIWIAVYLSISLSTSLFMNWFNARVALVER